MDPLSRYDPIVDDPSAFHAACDRPLPSVVRVNGIKATPDRVRRAFEAAGVGFDPVGWHEGLFRLHEGESPGNSWPFVHGWVYGQEEVSAVPALALDPRPASACLIAVPRREARHTARGPDGRPRNPRR